MSTRIEFEDIVLGDDKIKITAITGLSGVEENSKVVTFVGKDGQKSSNFQKMPRIINVACTIKGDDAIREYQKIVKCMYKSIELVIRNSISSKKITCRITKTSDYVMLCDTIVDFAIQFMADSPFFNDLSKIKQDLFYIRATPLLTGGKFVLPWVFSTRVNESTVINLGDSKTYPVIVIYCSKSGATPVAPKGIFVKNNTTNQTFYLNYKTSTSETITIDMQKSKVMSSINGNLAEYISTLVLDGTTYKTYLGKFWLDTGANDIVVTNLNVNDIISCYCSYDNNYIEAVN